MVFGGHIMVVTWFSDDQPSYNTMVDIDTNMVHHVSTLFATAAQADNLDEEEVAIVMETAEVMERGRKDEFTPPAWSNLGRLFSAILLIYLG